jgi:hypothetical protein
VCCSIAVKDLTYVIFGHLQTMDMDLDDPETLHPRTNLSQPVAYCHIGNRRTIEVRFLFSHITQDCPRPGEYRYRHMIVAKAVPRHGHTVLPVSRLQDDDILRRWRAPVLPEATGYTEWNLHGGLYFNLLVRNPEQLAWALRVTELGVFLFSYLHLNTPLEGPIAYSEQFYTIVASRKRLRDDNESDCPELALPPRNPRMALF